jgi:uncharacterized protein (TIGR04255 family)
MAEDIKFEAPPVVETALSVQFASLPGFSAAHAGWFWKEYVEKLGDGPPKEWKQVAEAVRLPDQFEKFGPEDIWVPPSLRVTQGVVSPRVQIIREDSERMIQVQDTRFVLNWRKRTSSYPTYETLLPEFLNMLHAFESFCAEAGLGVPVYNQWEVVYVDQVKKGTMWDSARDLGRIFPGLLIPPVSNRHAPPSGDETISADWRFSLVNRRGRLYISLRQMRVQPSNEEVINLTTIARGPVNESQSWEQGFNFGHDALRETFLAVTSSEAKEYWKKRR